MGTPAASSHCHRYPAEIIAHCVRVSYRFPLSYRGVEELMLERGIAVSYESTRRWCLKLGPLYAAEIRRRRPQPQSTPRWATGRTPCGERWMRPTTGLTRNGDDRGCRAHYPTCSA